MRNRPLPIVLAGGESRRFGRDKLREPYGEAMLVDVPLGALRAVFGTPVALAGACHKDVAARADLVIPDAAPGCGPMGGIVAGMEHPLGSHGVFVLAGDLAKIGPEEVSAIWESALRHEDAWAVLADTGMLEPCVGLYRMGSLPALRERLKGGRLSLHDALPSARVTRAKMEKARLKNVNLEEDLRRDG